MKKIFRLFAMLIVFSICFAMVVPVMAETVSNIEIDISKASEIYDGEQRENSFVFWGNNSYESYAEFDIQVEKSGNYKLNAQYENGTVEGLSKLEFGVYVDGISISGHNIVPTENAFNSKLINSVHDAIPLTAGTHKLRISQLTLEPHIIITMLNLEYAGKYHNVDETVEIAISGAKNSFDAEVASNAVRFWNNEHESYVDYDVNVLTTGNYKLTSTYASVVSEGVENLEFGIMIDGVNISGQNAVSSTDDYNVYTTAALHDAIPLTAGTHTIRIKQLTLASTVILTNFTLKYAGIYKYHNENETIEITVSAAKNSFDAEVASNAVRFWNNEHESYVDYDVNVLTTGNYKLTSTYASKVSDGVKNLEFGIMVDGVDISGQNAVSSTDDYNVYATESLHDAIPLTAGTHTIRIKQLTLASTVVLTNFTLKYAGAYSNGEGLYKVESDGSETEITMPQEGNLRIKNNIDVSQDGIVIVALYNGDKLIRASKEKDLTAGNNRIEIDVNNVTAECTSIKIFAWDNFMNIKPLNSCVEYPKQ